MAAEPARDTPDLSKPPQYKLRSLFVLIALLAVLFAVMGTIGPLGSAAMLLFLAFAALHVTGNALGTKLRDRASDQSQWQTSSGLAAGVRSIRRPSSRLSEHTPLGWIIRSIIVAGALAGGTLGGLTFGQFTGSPSQLAVGILSFAVLGAFFGFLGGSFLAMTLRAWNQAVHEPLPADIDAR